MMFSKKIKTAMILGAGFGTRLKPLTDNIPKVLIKVAGISMLERIIIQLKAVGINKIIINTHYLHEKVDAFVQNIKGIEVFLSHEPVILGTGGGILKAMQDFDIQQMLVVNCDCLLYANNDFSPYSQLIEAWKSDEMVMLALLHDKMKLPYPIQQGDFNLNENNLLIRDKSNDNKYIFLGAYILNKSIFKNHKPTFFPITDIIYNPDQELLPIKGIVNSHQWFDTGNHKCLEIADRFFNEH